MFANADNFTSDRTRGVSSHILSLNARAMNFFGNGSILECLDLLKTAEVELLHWLSTQCEARSINVTNTQQIYEEQSDNSNGYSSQDSISKAEVDALQVMTSNNMAYCHSCLGNQKASFRYLKKALSISQAYLHLRHIEAVHLNMSAMLVNCLLKF